MQRFYRNIFDVITVSKFHPLAVIRKFRMTESSLTFFPLAQTDQDAIIKINGNTKRKI